MKQKERVLEYAKRNGSITSLEAINELGVTRLASVIFTLEKEGNIFNHKMVRVSNRFGEECRVARYELIDA